MKFIKYAIALAVIFLFIQCNGKPERPDSVLNETQKAYDGNDLNTQTTAPPPTAEPAQNAAGVWHYTCADGCAGGGGKAEPCGVCGKMLAHNTVYHEGQNQPGANQTAQPGNTISFDPNNPSPAGQTISFDPSTGTVNGNANNSVVTLPQNQNTPKPPEPAQNADGVWHYTCSAGCSGGAGSASACAGCGATLVHNTSYH